MKNRQALVPTFFLLGALVLLPATLPAVDRAYLAAMHRGAAAEARLERTSAVEAYRAAARWHPFAPQPYLDMARLYLGWGREAEALEALTQAEARGADAAALAWWRWQAYTARADWPAAIEQGERWLALYAADDGPAGEAVWMVRAARLRRGLGRAYLQVGEWEAARSVYEAMLADVPPDATEPLASFALLAHERLGLMEVGERDDAVYHLFAAHTELAGQVLAVLQSPGAAGDPTYAATLIGRTLFTAEEWALAVHHFERALSFGGDRGIPELYAYLGYAWGRMGCAECGEKALAYLERAVQETPDSAVAYTLLGLYYDQQGQNAAARAAYEQAYDLDPTNPALCVEIGQTWAVEGRYVAAEIWLREAVALRPDDPQLWETLARFYLDNNLYVADRGIEAVERLLELSPETATAHDLRAWAALEMGDYVTAQAHLNRALSLDPMQPSAHYHLGWFWLTQGQRTKAEEAFRRAVDLDTTGVVTAQVARLFPIERQWLPNG